MLFVLCLLTTAFLRTGFSLPSSAKGDSEPTISECAAKGGECDESKGRPVCGTDNQTYPTRCHLIRAQCSGHQVSLKHRGTCKDACIASRSYALAHRNSSPFKFVPRCRTDGSYAPVQCLDGAGCWCVNGQGKPVPHTTVRTGKPNCVKNSKSNTRRSPPRSIIRNNKRGCTKSDKAQFNGNLLKVFYSEHSRSQHSQNAASTQSQLLQTGAAASVGAANDKIVLDWKFVTMDANNNHMLDKIEYRELKRLVKKVVKPKRCARAFGKYCDIDHDERLSRQEWGNCISKDGLSPETEFATSDSGGVGSVGGGSVGGGGGGGIGGSNVDNDHNRMVDEEDDYNDSDDESSNEDDSTDTDNTLGATPPFMTPVSRFQPGFLLRGKTSVELNGDGVLRETDGDSDCLADRTAALDEQKVGTPMYVPECTADGRYQRVQCYRSTGYCWCVHEDTGKNIPGTSTKDQRPQCDAIVSPARPMKGCPDGKKTEFLDNLKDFLKMQVASNTNNGGVNTTKWATEDEKIATLSFVFLDKNKNKVWERKEWKIFRELVTSSRTLRKCGKKMPRYCDVNNDRKITLSEWLNCLQVKRIPVDALKVEPRPIQPSKFKGPNPLESYLKSD